MKKLMKKAKRDIRTITAKRDQDIDFSDATAVLDWSGAEIGKVLSANEEARYDASGF